MPEKIHAKALEAVRKKANYFAIQDIYKFITSVYPAITLRLTWKQLCLSKLI